MINRLESDDSINQSKKDFNIDMDISVIVQPIKLVYRPTVIEKLILFFYVEDL